MLWCIRNQISIFQGLYVWYPMTQNCQHVDVYAQGEEGVVQVLLQGGRRCDNHNHYYHHHLGGRRVRKVDCLVLGWVTTWEYLVLQAFLFDTFIDDNLIKDWFYNQGRNWSVQQGSDWLVEIRDFDIIRFLGHIMQTYSITSIFSAVLWTVLPISNQDGG